MAVLRGMAIKSCPRRRFFRHSRHSKWLEDMQFTDMHVVYNFLVSLIIPRLEICQKWKTVVVLTFVRWIEKDRVRCVQTCHSERSTTPRSPSRHKMTVSIDRSMSSITRAAGQTPLLPTCIPIEPHLFVLILAVVAAVV
jgi:hypothetical protein